MVDVPTARQNNCHTIDRLVQRSASQNFSQYSQWHSFLPFRPKNKAKRVESQPSQRSLAAENAPFTSSAQRLLTLHKDGISGQEGYSNDRR
jgi:hypothetical protein